MPRAARALMAALHPDWTPAEVQSALMTTGFTGATGTTVPRSTGSIWARAGSTWLGPGNAGLVLDETGRLPGADPPGWRPHPLNLPSMADDLCLATDVCAWHRTVRSGPASVPVTWAGERGGLPRGPPPSR